MGTTIRAVGAEHFTAVILYDASGNALISSDGLEVQGGVASGAADSGNPVKVGGKYNLTRPTLADGQRGDIQLDSRGNAGVVVMNGTSLAGVAALSDAQGGIAGLDVRAHMDAYNGASQDRWRNNTEGTLLASAARTATTSSADQVNYNSKGIIVYLSITAVPSIETVTLTITAKDPIAGTYETLLTGSVEVATATRAYMVYPGAGAAANGIDVVAAYPLPRTFRVTVTHSASGSFTYSVGYALIN